jgi:hypothetical protein
LGLRVDGLSKEPAKFVGKSTEVPEFLFVCKSVHLQVTVLIFMINMLINPQTTCKLPANVTSGLPNALTILVLIVSNVTGV